jgi:NADH-quinone oxidoreductase subunit C
MLETLSANLHQRFSHRIVQSTIAFNELTMDVLPEHLHEIALILRDDPEFNFVMLMDVCGVDYLHYGLSEWETESATSTGFERGVDSSALKQASFHSDSRFGVVYHLLSLHRNWRLRLRVQLPAEEPIVDSVVGIWPAANWFEREAFDLFGIIFKGHPDLRRLLTDYGFVGYPFRKDFPLSGNVEVRYDAALQRVIYEPVRIEPRVLEPKVIRRDSRYEKGE